MHDIVRQVTASAPVGQGVVACACLPSECADGTKRWKLSPSFLSCTSLCTSVQPLEKSVHITTLELTEAPTKHQRMILLFPCGSLYHSIHCPCCCRWGSKLFMVLWVACRYHYFFEWTHPAKAHQSTSTCPTLSTQTGRVYPYSTLCSADVSKSGPNIPPINSEIYVGP